MERKGIITMKGNPMTLLGNAITVGQKAPEFTVLDTGLKPVTLASLAGKAKIISVTPSLDTPVCDKQARRFNEEAAKLAGAFEIINISMDLPFAANRFCSSAGIANVRTLSDHRDASFGQAFGVLIKELRLLARAVFILDPDNVVRYAEIASEVTSEVDYEKALAAAKSLATR